MWYTFDIRLTSINALLLSEIICILKSLFTFNLLNHDRRNSQVYKQTSSRLRSSNKAPNYNFSRFTLLSCVIFGEQRRFTQATNYFCIITNKFQKIKCPKAPSYSIILKPVVEKLIEKYLRSNDELLPK